jgi:hypothetical protein
MSDTCNTFCSTTRDQRRTILLLEALALIHDIGKLSDRFLSESSSNYSYDLFINLKSVELFNKAKPDQESNASKQVNKWNESCNNPENCAFSELPGLTAHLQSLEISDWNATSYTLAELAPFAMHPSYGNAEYEWNSVLNKSMQPGLLIAFMHGIAHFDKEDIGEKQPSNDLFRATPFGYEELIPQGETSNILSKLPFTELSKITTSERHSWLCKMRDGMSKGIADNRRPINDVTLWDWGYLVASLTKASANYIFFNKGWPQSLGEIEIVILQININKLELYASSDKISDLLGKKETLDEAYSLVKTLLEETVALGNRIYHDETGDYYLMPNIFSGEERDALRQAVQKIFPKDLRPRIHFGKPVTFDELDIRLHRDDKKSVTQAISQLIAVPRIETKKERTVQADNNHYFFDDEWGKDRPENSEICSVCGKRPVGYPTEAFTPDEEKELVKWATREKAEERNVCRLCLARRGRRAEEWENNIHESQLCTTIWTDEVADNNGRLAMFVGTFGLEKWLYGSMLETTRLSKKNAKNPSPARLFRITETARSFWEKINDECLSECLESKSYRLQLIPVNPEPLDLGHFHTFELEYADTTLATVWRKPEKNKPGYFLTIENLDRLARKLGIRFGNLPTIEMLTKRFSGNCSVRIPSVGIVKHNISCRVVPSMVSYIPAIPFLSEPGLCMILLPADKSLLFVKSVKTFYEKQMNKVQDRLPLGAGLVFFPGRTPIRAVMEAGQSMLDILEKMPSEEWAVQKKPGKPDIEGYIELQFHNGKTLKFKQQNGSNQNISDDWYLWHYGIRQNPPIKIGKLRNNDTLKLVPCRFDFEFLDTAGRRYEICYDEKGKRGTTRPFYLADFERMEELWNHFEHLSLSQRHQIIGLIEAKREEWCITIDSSDEKLSTFRQFVYDTLAGANWPKEKKWNLIDENSRKNLVEAGTSGQLKDWAELHMQILKEKNGGCE